MPHRHDWCPRTHARLAPVVTRSVAIQPPRPVPIFARFACRNVILCKRAPERLLDTHLCICACLPLPSPFRNPLTGPQRNRKSDRVSAHITNKELSTSGESVAPVTSDEVRALELESRCRCRLARQCVHALYADVFLCVGCRTVSRRISNGSNPHYWGWDRHHLHLRR